MLPACLDCAAHFDKLNARLRKQRTRMKDMEERINKLEKKRKGDFVSDHKYVKLDQTFFSLKNKPINRSESHNCFLISHSRFFRYVAKKYWGEDRIKSSTAGKLPKALNKVVNAIIVSSNAFCVLDGVEHRCIGVSQMDEFFKTFRSLFLTMGVELRTFDKKKARLSASSTTGDSSSFGDSLSDNISVND